jgi:holo-[acyl-carrier protein] synthase
MDAKIISHGIDMVECRRIGQMLERYGDRFLERVFTPLEQQYSLNRKRRIEHLAGRFAVKEAVMKVLGTGWRDGIAWTDIETANDPAGRPAVRLSGKVASLAAEMGINKVLVSISHADDYAIASAIAVG